MVAVNTSVLWGLWTQVEHNGCVWLLNNYVPFLILLLLHHQMYLVFGILIIYSCWNIVTHFFILFLSPIMLSIPSPALIPLKTFPRSKPLYLGKSKTIKQLKNSDTDPDAPVWLIRHTLKHYLFPISHPFIMVCWPCGSVGRACFLQCWMSWVWFLLGPSLCKM